jgi:anti-sigma factor RsiW
MKDHLSPEDIYDLILEICSGEERAAFGKHLDACEACRSEMEDSRNVLKLLDSLNVPILPEKRWKDLLTNAAGQSSPRDLAGKKSQKPAFHFVMRLAWGFALIILVFICGYLAGVSHAYVRIIERTRSVPEKAEITPVSVSIAPSSGNEILHNHSIIYTPAPSNEDAAALQTLRSRYTSESKIKGNDAVNGETINNTNFPSI